MPFTEELTMKNSLLALIIITLLLAACRDMTPVDPQFIPDEKVKGIYINPDFLRPTGIDTLFINEGDTVTVGVRSILINKPTYTWSSGNEGVLKIMPDANHDSLAYAIAVADSGNQTTLTLTDQSNSVSKTIPVVVVKFWADPMFYSYLGNIYKHHYYMSRYKKTWLQARDDCASQGGHLMTITDPAENALIDTSSIRNRQEVWIGLTFLYNNDKLTKWITGEDVTYENYNGKPSDPGIFAEYFFYMDANGRWENWHEILYYYILEME